MDEKNYDRLIPRIAFLIEGIMEHEGVAALVAQYSTFVMQRDYNVYWTRSKWPYVLRDDELTFAYFNECKNVKSFQERLILAKAPFLRGIQGSILIRDSVDLVSNDLGVLLRLRANADDNNL